MKQTNTRLLLSSSLVFVMALSSAAAYSFAQNSDTVSIVGGTQTAPEEFPPQPVGVAPTEEQTTTVTPDAQPDTTSVTPSAPTAPAAEVKPAAPQPQAPLAKATPVPEHSETVVVPGEGSGSVKGTNVMGDTGKTKHSGTYYDSRAVVPDSDLAAAGATGPRKVDPALEPGQKFVVVEKGPGAGTIEAQYVAATRALKLGRYAAAMEMFEKMYKRSHKDPRILMGLAVSQQGAGFNESAARTYEELLAVEPNNADAIINLMGLMRAQYPSITMKKLQELRNKYPNNPGIPAQIAQISAEAGNYDDAIKYFEVAASMDPRNASHIYNMAIVSDRKGKVSQAIKLYERALQLDASYGDAANSLPREVIYDRLVVLRRKV